MSWKNKKAASELTSFILITLIVVVASTGAYTFISSALDKKISESERDNMEEFLRAFNLRLESMKNFDSSSQTFPIEFKKGILSFQTNSLVYYSQVRYFEEETYCFRLVCSRSGTGNYEEIFINLDDYTFSGEYALEPGRYIIHIENIKDETEWKISFR